MWKPYRYWYGFHMEQEPDGRTYRGVLHEIALGEYGLVSTRDARDEGISPVELRKLAARGALERVGHGLYRDLAVPATDLDQYALAVRLVGEGAYLMGASVLAMHDLALVNPSRVMVGTPHRVWQRLPAFVQVVQRELPAQALTVHEGIASSTVAQAIVDCMDVVMGSRLREAINEAGRRHLLTSREQKALRARLDRRSRSMRRSAG